MHIPTVLSVTDVTDRRPPPRQSDRAGAKNLRSPSRTTRLSSRITTGGPSTLLVALGGIALAVLMIAIFHIAAAAFTWSDVRDFVAPTAAEARAHGWQALSERAAP